MRRGLPILAGLAACAALASVAVAFRPTGHMSLSAVAQVRAALAAHYYRPLAPGVLSRPTVESLLAGLGDPYTAYLTPAEAVDLRDRQAGRYSGIGVTVTARRGDLVVTSAPPGPARAAGLRPGDVIVSVDGKPVADRSTEEVIQQIVGPEGVLVKLTARRKSVLHTFRIVRADVVSPSVRVSVLTRGGRTVAVLRVFRFGTGTADRLRSAVLGLRARGVTGYVLDLRSNPGGLLAEAVRTASLFLDGGVVTTISGAHQPERVLRADANLGATRLPVVVVVNRFSASASEVVAAALQDNGRALVVGERTYGKALVQDVEPLSGGAALRLTVARYLTPGGHDISRSGVTPDVVAADDPATLADEALPEALAALPVR